MLRPSIISFGRDRELRVEADPSPAEMEEALIDLMMASGVSVVRDFGSLTLDPTLQTYFAKGQPEVAHALSSVSALLADSREWHRAQAEVRARVSSVRGAVEAYLDKLQAAIGVIALDRDVEACVAAVLGPPPSSGSGGSGGSGSGGGDASSASSLRATLLRSMSGNSVTSRVGGSSASSLNLGTRRPPVVGNPCLVGMSELSSSALLPGSTTSMLEAVLDRLGMGGETDVAATLLSVEQFEAYVALQAQDGSASVQASIAPSHLCGPVLVCNARLVQAVAAAVQRLSDNIQIMLPLQLRIQLDALVRDANAAAARLGVNPTTLEESIAWIEAAEAVEADQVGLESRMADVDALWAISQSLGLPTMPDLERDMHDLARLMAVISSELDSVDSFIRATIRLHGCVFFFFFFFFFFAWRLSRCVQMDFAVDLLRWPFV